jgi:hypothetical protein
MKALKKKYQEKLDTQQEEKKESVVYELSKKTKMENGVQTGEMLETRQKTKGKLSDKTVKKVVYNPDGSRSYWEEHTDS